MTDADIIEALKKVAHTYSKDIAVTVEKIFRTETKHFKSSNFFSTLSPGMEARTAIAPYGWTSLAQYWKDNPQYAPKGIFGQIENSTAWFQSKGEKKFIQFTTIEASMMSVAFIINARGGDGGTWFSKTEPYMTNYRNFLKQIGAKFCGTF